MRIAPGWQDTRPVGTVFVLLLCVLIVVSIAAVGAWLPRRFARGIPAQLLLGVAIGLAAGATVVSLWIDVIPDSNEDSIAIGLAGLIALGLAFRTYRVADDE